MADPFSVTGTAVGITSLGIQTCQVLFRYYSQFRGIHQDIDDIVERVETLECILERLVTVKEKLSSFESILNLETALVSCVQGSQRLKDLASKIHDGSESKSYQDRLRAVRGRFMWPFRKETLMDLKSTLGDFQDNLALALQVSGLDVTLQTVNDLKSTTNGVDRRTAQMEIELKNQSDAIVQVQEGIETVASTQHEQATVASQELASVAQKLDFLVCITALQSHLASTKHHTRYHESALVTLQYLSPH